LLLEQNIDLGTSTCINDLLKTLSRHHIKKKAVAFSREELFQYFWEAPNTGRKLVAKLIAITGFYAGLRSCELVALCWEDINFSQEGILVRIARSKTDQAGVGATKLLPKLSEEAICPVFYYTKYRGQFTEATGRLFRQFQNGKYIKSPMGKNMISNVPHEIAFFLGLKDPNIYTGHALRVSSATTLADGGADILELKRHGRWSSSFVAEEYVCESKSARLDTASKLSGTSLVLNSNITKAASGDQSNKILLPNCVFNGPVHFHVHNPDQKQD
jgi:integrase